MSVTVRLKPRLLADMKSQTSREASVATANARPAGLVRQTSTTDATVLRSALEQLGAVVGATSGDSFAAARGAMAFALERVEGAYFCTAYGGDAGAADEFFSELERTVGLTVQSRVAELARAQAESLGFRLVTETDQHGTIQLVFEALA